MSFSQLTKQPLPLGAECKGLEARGAYVGVGPSGTYVSLGASGFEYRSKADGAPDSAALVITSAKDSRIEAEIRLERASLSGWYFAFACLLWTGSCVLGPVGLLVGLVLSFAGAIPFTKWNTERRSVRLIYDVMNPEIVERLAVANVVGRCLGGSHRVWHVTQSNAIANPKKNAGAKAELHRAEANCTSGTTPNFELNIDVACLEAGDTRLLFLPDRVLVWNGKQLGAIPYAIARVSTAATQFVEHGAIPGDSRRVGTTWRYVRSDGQRDQRFVDNAELPVMEYGSLMIEGEAGLRIAIQTSNPAGAEGAAAAMLELVRRAGAMHAQSPQSNTFGAPPSAASSLPKSSVAAIPQQHAPVAASAASIGLPFQVQVQASRPSKPVHASDKLRWLPRGQAIVIHGVTIEGGFLYVGAQSSAWEDREPSALYEKFPIDTRYPARSGEGMNYWPAYSDISPACRAAYLEWLVTGRNNPDAYIGYVFLYFYGLERRALVEKADTQEIRAEVQRLLALYAHNNSFRSYASSFLAMTLDVSGMDENATRAELASLLAAGHRDALARLVSWYIDRDRGLPTDVATLLAEGDERATRSVVVTRARGELESLFGIRYAEKFGTGIVLKKSRKQTQVGYHAASAALRSRTFSVAVAPVFERAAELKPLVDIWNASVDNLRKFSSAQRRSVAAEENLTVEMWEAMPPELRSGVDHPRLEAWTAGALAAPRCGPGYRLPASQLARMAGLDAREKYTAGQTRRIAEIAAQLCFVIEPDPRASNTTATSETPFVVWRSDALDLPDARVYGAASMITRLAMHIALADGHVDESELEQVAAMVEELFVLDPAMRERIAALRHLLLDEPAKVGPLTKKLAETQSATQRGSIGRLLVAVAAADGVLHSAEKKSLQTIYKGLGLPSSHLDETLIGFGMQLEDDAPVVAARGTAPRKGSAVRAPDDVAKPPSIRLDPKAIESILADTREVAAMLASVLDTDDEQAPAPGVTAVRDDVPAASPGADAPSEFPGLASAYHAIVRELLTRPSWSQVDVRELATRHRAMPGAIFDTINEWSDEHLGDVLITDDGEWTIRQDLK